MQPGNGTDNGSMEGGAISDSLRGRRHTMMAWRGGTDDDSMERRAVNDSLRGGTDNDGVGGRDRRWQHGEEGSQ